MENVTAAEVAGRILRDVRPLFYLELPSTSSFQHMADVPDYVKQVFPYFFVLIFMEVAVRWLQGQSPVRLNDSINSLSAGLIFMLTEVLFGTFEIGTYVWFYNYFCVLELPWDSPLTWLGAFLGVDCCFYWFHRMAHEVNLFWAAHQVHHSSEDYTLSTALRQSAAQRFTSWFVYLPLGLVLPPPAYFAHRQLNLLYQFWIHTEVIDRLGPLEWVLNTPSHHRVHHGRNPYCIDCNYAGFLIIWDRMFGTFQPEMQEEKVIYGLVHPLSSWDPLWAQVHHFAYLWRRVWGGTEGWSFKLQFLFKGPGWSPGKPRLGLREDIPQVSPDEKPYDHTLSTWQNVYIVTHFVIVVMFSMKLGDNHMYLHPVVTLAVVVYLIFSATIFGLMLDHAPLSVPLEVARLAVLLATDLTLSHYSLLPASILPYPALVCLRGLVLMSLALWTIKLGAYHTPTKID